MTTPMFVGKVHVPSLKTGDKKSWFHMVQGNSLMKLEYDTAMDASIAHEQLTFASNAHEVKSDKLLSAIHDALVEASTHVSRRTVPPIQEAVPDETEDKAKTDPVEPLDFPGKSTVARRF